MSALMTNKGGQRPKVETLPGVLFLSAKESANKPFYSFRSKSSPPSLHTYTWAKYETAVRRCAAGLVRLGLPFQGTVAISSSTRFEWALVAHSIQAAGGVPVGVYHTCSAVETAYIISHSEAKIVFVENVEQYMKLQIQKGKLGHIQHIILIDGFVEDDKRVMSWDMFVRLCDEAKEENEVVNQRLNDLKPDDLATLIYTSGTTGPPKAVMLTQRNVVFMAATMASLVPVIDNGRSVAFLPFAHIAEQLFSLYLPFYTRNHVLFIEGMEKLVEYMREFQPTHFFAPPRLWEKLYAALSPKVPAGTSAANLPEHIKKALLTSVGMSQAVWASTGAAPIATHILQFFQDLGLTLYEVYGQSEAAGPTTINYPGKVKLGSVGPPLPGMELKIAADGEILERGPNIFKGYYKDEETTRETLRDGWLYSGDLGRVDEEGFVYITGRKKDIIITAGGKNITPINIEHAIKAHPLVGDAVMIGDRRPYPVALVTLDVDVAGGICKEKAISYEQLSKDPEIIQQVEKHIEKVNEDLAQVEKIKKFMILPRPFQIDKGEVTPTMKVKRSFINQAYAAEIERLYSISTARL
jgi:long-chain acyl-CoA synthetase